MASFLKNTGKYFLRELCRVKRLFVFLLLLLVLINFVINPALRYFKGWEIAIPDMLKQHGFPITKKPGETVVPVTEKEVDKRIETTEISKDEIVDKLKRELEQISSYVYLTQQYPSSQEYSYEQSIDLRTNPAVMTWKISEQPFWIGIANTMLNKNYRKPTLFLNFEKKVTVRVDQQIAPGWVEMEPNSQYYLKLHSDLQPMTTYRLNPLFITFPKEGDYTVRFGIRGDNELPIGGDFKIKVVK